MDVVALRSLQELARTGSMVSTAAALGFTASAVSQQIKRLEQQVGLPLTERNGRGVVLTVHGVALAEHAAGVFDALLAAESAAHEVVNTVSGRVRVGSFATACRGLVIPIFGDLNESLDVTLRELDPPECVDAVHRSQLDLGVVHNWDRVALEVPDDISAESIGTDTTYVLTAADSPLGRRHEVSPTELLDEPWVIQETGMICRAMFTQLFANSPHQPRIVAERNEYETQVALAREGLACAVVPALAMSEAPPGTALIPIAAPRPTREIFLVWRGSATNSAALRHVRSLIRTAARRTLSTTP